jgi:beta-lactamase class C
VLGPLGLLSTSIPERGMDDGCAQLAPELMRRAVQGYSVDGNAVGTPGDQQGLSRFSAIGLVASCSRQRP